MEKLGVVAPEVTPNTEDLNLNVKAADCNANENMDNKERKIDALDNDFRKRAANQVTGQLRT